MLRAMPGWRRISPLRSSVMPNGQPAAATAPSCGGGFGPPASEAVCELSVWATRRRRAEGAGRETLRKVPPARVLSRLMLSLRDHLTKEDAITVASIERGVPILVPARDLVERFHRMVRDRDPDALPAWITDAAGSVLASFGKGIVADQAAVVAALTQPWSNGQTEGQITRLKLVKRQMYGRAKLDLLRARLIVPA